MEFLIERFITILNRDYNISAKHKRNKDGSHSLYMTNIDDGLRNKILKLKYEVVTKITKIYTSDDDEIGTRFVTSNIKMSRSYGTDGVVIKFTDSNYGQKLNKLEYCIRRYYEKNSLIERINSSVY